MLLLEPEVDRPPPGGIRRYLTRLQSADDASTGAVVSREACASPGSSKAMFSWVNGPSWTPEHVHVGPDVDAEFGDLVAAVDGTAEPLLRAPREADLVRWRRPYVLGRRDFHREAYRPLIDLSDPDAYATAPIVANGRTVAILHVDRHHSAVNDDDMRLLILAARVTGVVLATNENRRRVRRQADGLAELFDEVMRPDRSARPDRGFVESRADDVGKEPARGRAALAELTEREDTVLQLLASGATNRQIAEQLFISDGTVKSHARRIFRKIGVESRAQAAVRYREIKTATTPST